MWRGMMAIDGYLWLTEHLQYDDNFYSSSHESVILLINDACIATHERHFIVLFLFFTVINILKNYKLK